MDPRTQRSGFPGVWERGAACGATFWNNQPVRSGSRIGRVRVNFGIAEPDLPDTCHHGSMELPYSGMPFGTEVTET